MLPGANISYFFETELDEVFKNSITNNWIKHAYVQGFDCEYDNFKETLTCLNTWKYQNLLMNV